MAGHRYWRLFVTSFNSWLSATELEFRETAGGADVCNGGTAFASGIWNGSIAGAFDNDTGTNWKFLGGAPVWIGYDLGAGNEKEIVEIAWRVASAGEEPSAFAVQFSDNGQEWMTAWTEVGLTGFSTTAFKVMTKTPEKTPPLAGGYHNYWRLFNWDSNIWCRLAEIELRAYSNGPDLTGSGTAITSGGVAGNAVDNNVTTYWEASAFGVGSWWGYNFGTGKLIRQLVITNPSNGNAPGVFDLQYSDDGVTWVAAATYSELSGLITWSASQTKTFGFAPAMPTVTFDGVFGTNVEIIDAYTIDVDTPAHASGAVGVVLTRPESAMPATATAGYTYEDPAITFTSISPNTGSTAGGTPVTLTGTNFLSPATVTFDGVGAVDVVVVNGTTITCTAPVHAIAGAVDVALTTNGQTATRTAAFTYEAPPPPPAVTLDIINPNTGTTAGGTAVTLTGSQFLAGATVSFGGAVATNVVVVNSTTITCTTPPHASGAVDVVLDTNGQTATLLSGFTYILPVTAGVPLIVTGATITAATATGEGGPYVYDPLASPAVTATRTTTVSAIQTHESIRLLPVTDAANFPDAEGYLCFGFGWDYQASPVRYLGKTSGGLLLDPNYRFPQGIPAGSSVILLAGKEAHEPGADAVSLSLTNTGVGLRSAEAIVDHVRAAGLPVEKSISYPPDHGLGGAGAATKGEGKLSDVVRIFGGDNLDEEVDKARER